MSKLTELPNIGPELAKRLESVGITTPGKLAKCGSIGAFRMIRERDENGCTNMLYALEGAIQGIRWHDLPKEIRAKLKRRAFGDS